VLKIFDALGKLVCRKTIKANGMLYHQDISFLKKGVYLVVVGGSSSPLIIQ
jgi:hypothetical protein